MNNTQQLEIFQKLLKYYKEKFVEASKYKSKIDLHKFLLDSYIDLGVCYCCKQLFDIDLYRNEFISNYIKNLNVDSIFHSIWQYPEKQDNLIDIKEAVHKRIEFLEYAVKTLS